MRYRSGNELCTIFGILSANEDNTCTMSTSDQLLMSTLFILMSDLLNNVCRLSSIVYLCLKPGRGNFRLGRWTQGNWVTAV